MRRVYLIRHGLTEGNRLRRYIGRTDEPLCAAGRAALSAAQLKGIETVYVSPLLRARETAAILFPHARQIVVDGLREMDFGAFENRSADDMKNDAAYRAWVDGLCEGDCPGGENRRGFVARTVRAFENICAAGRDAPLVIVAHGGTVMALMSELGEPKKDYWAWHVGAGGCLRCALDGGRLLYEGDGFDA